MQRARVLVPAAAAVALGWLSCSFDESGLDDQGRDGGGGIDAADDGGACMPGCLSETQLRDCVSPTPVTCPLGCTGDEGAGHCAALVPSNGANPDDLDEVTAGLEVPSRNLYVNTDTGLIQRTGGGQPVEQVRAGVAGLDAGIRFTTLGPTLSVLAVDHVDVAASGQIQLEGTRGLILLVRGAVDIRGLVDASGGCLDSDLRGCGGPGGGDGGTNENVNGQGCGPGIAGHGGASDETGGGGGGMGQSGKSGGASGGNAGGAAGSASACPGPSLVPLRGGGGGGMGGGGQGGAGGGGGGGLQITSLESIRIEPGKGQVTRPVIDAGGAGGAGSANNGGGGGGAGGGILLEAPLIAFANAAIVANGAGGGDGNGSPEGPVGTDGRHDATAALGGGAGTDGAGGSGGTGAIEPTVGLAGALGLGIDGTGGGGGGGGIIRLNVPASGLAIDGTTVVSPAHTRGELTIQ
jgi:hypothetical protein